MTIRGRVGAKAVDALVVLGFLLGSLVVLNRLWRHTSDGFLYPNAQDTYQFEWFLTHATQVFTRGESPFFSDQMNMPRGINLMANTSVLVLALPLTPVTLLFGAGVTFAVITTLALAGTATAWYWALHRHLGRSRVAAIVGGTFLGFCPAIISQDVGHPNIAGQYLIPLIVVAVLRMRHAGRVWRHGLVLAALVVLQAGINEEMLFFTALALGVFVLSYVPWRQLPGYARIMAPKAGVTLLVAGALLAYPLYRQFFGAQTYHGLDGAVRAINIDVVSYASFSQFSLAGDAAEAFRINRGAASEENSFFGWPLALLLVAGAITLWRDRLTRALIITASVFAVMSFGSNIRFNGVDHTHVHGPWKWISKLPLFDTVVPTRLALVVSTVVGIGLALLVDKLVVERLRPAAPAEPEPVAAPEPEPIPVLVGSAPAADAERPAATATLPAEPPRTGAAPGPARHRRLVPIAWGVAIAAALVPIIPKPLPLQGRPPVPELFTTAMWRTELPADAVVVRVPSGFYENYDVMRWSTATDLRIRFAGGYFLGPNEAHPEDKNAHFGPADRPTVQNLNRARGGVDAPETGAEQRAALRDDVRYWKATTLVMPTTPYLNLKPSELDIMRRTLDALVAPDAPPARLVGGVWLWDVRTLNGTG